jgi:hypothetical protein
MSTVKCIIDAHYHWKFPVKGSPAKPNMWQGKQDCVIPSEELSSYSL